ncbi:MAG: TRAP transporter substrate-binding protein DctP [Gemmatimonadota bacterium]
MIVHANPHRSRHPVLLAAILALGVQTVLAGPAAAQVVVKLASLVPDGSAWDMILEDQVHAWEHDTGGRLEVRVYPGGVAGDDPAVIRKMRIGQFQAAGVTFQGLSEIDAGFRIFVLPLFYASQEELEYVVQKLDPILRRRLEDRGFVLLNWAYVGWGRFYSKKPIRTPDDLRAQKLFLWGGDDQEMRIYRSHGLEPVGVAGTDVTLALETGMIECIATTPAVALTFQWFRQVPYQMDEPLAPLVGATIMTRKVWDGLSEPDRAAILRASAHAQQRYAEELPVQDARAIAAMEERGLVRTTMAPESRAEWERLAAAMAQENRGTLIPADVFDAALSARNEFRARHGGSR